MMLGDEDAYSLEGSLHPLPPHVAPWMGPRRDCSCVGQSFIVENAASDGAAQMKNLTLGVEVQKCGSQQSLAAQDFIASGDLMQNEEIAPKI
jgi:hypothetical protein